MNPLEQLLDDELSSLLDRLAASVPRGCLQAAATRTPSLRRRLDEAEGQMAAIRAGLLEGYGRWRRALEDMENLWALAAWRAVGEGAPAEGSGAEQAAEEARSLAA
jgi:predicted transcriptional regulator